MSSATIRRQPASHRGVYALVGAVIALALAGGVMAASILTGDDVSGVHPHDIPGIGEPATTSFGAVRVQHVEKLGGLGGRALGGMTHGIANLVESDKMQVQVSATITNLSPKTLRYSPDQFQLRTSARKPVNLTGASVRPGTLQPDAAIDLRLTFVVPRKDARLWISFDDPGSREPVLVDLGRIQVANDSRSEPEKGHGH